MAAAAAGLAIHVSCGIGGGATSNVKGYALQADGRAAIGRCVGKRRKSLSPIICIVSATTLRARIFGGRNRGPQPELIWNLSAVCSNLPFEILPTDSDSF